MGAILLALAACDSVLGADFDQSHAGSDPDIVISGGGTPAVDASSDGSGAIFTKGCSTQLFGDCPSGPCFEGTCLAPKAIGLGAEHTCALLDNASVWCWGSNRYGQLGRSQNAGSDEPNGPAPVEGLANIVSLAVGGWFSCAVSSDGAAFCWGVNSDGELGRGVVSAYEWQPEQLALANVNVVFASKGGNPVEALGGHACARANNEVYCWGSNDSGQLGKSASTALLATPERAAELDDAQLIVLGFSDTCRANISVSCRGTHRFGIEPDGFHPDFLEISRGAAYTLAVGNGFAHYENMSGNVTGLGENSLGQLCDGTEQSASAKVVSLLPGPLIEVGDSVACSLGSDDVVRCCGSNKGLALADPNADHSVVPLTVENHVLELATGWAHSCVIVADDPATSEYGGIRCWGANSHGQTGRVGADQVQVLPVFWSTN